jgi:hypothetical protein
MILENDNRESENRKRSKVNKIKNTTMKDDRTKLRGIGKMIAQN